MSEPNKVETSPTPGFEEDELGVPRFLGEAVGDTWHAGYNNPFEKKLLALKDSRAAVDTKPFIYVHDDLEMCRAIALSIFGRAWRDHVMAIYDRVQTREAETRPSGEE